MRTKKFQASGQTPGRASRSADTINAVADALRHSSLNFFEPLGKSHNDMHITVKIGVAKPHLVDCATVAKQVPYGTVTVEPSTGGLNIDAANGSDELVIANAGILVHFEE